MTPKYGLVLRKQKHVENAEALYRRARWRLRIYLSHDPDVTGREILEELQRFDLEAGQHGGSREAALLAIMRWMKVEEEA